MKIKTVEGRQHFVVPMVMMTPGVRNSILYTPEELSKSAHLWNGKPILVHHPEAGERSGTPKVADSQKIGTVYNSRFENGKLVADAWIDVERVTQVDDRVLQAISTNQVTELSTGLYFGDGDRKPGVYGTEQYQFVGKTYIPDHLAILPDQTGSCSIAEGCGLMRNHSIKDDTMKPLGLGPPLFENESKPCGCHANNRQTDPTKRHPLGLPDMHWDKPTETPQASARTAKPTNGPGATENAGGSTTGGSRVPLGAPTLEQMFE